MRRWTRDVVLCAQALMGFAPEKKNRPRLSFQQSSPPQLCILIPAVLDTHARTHCLIMLLHASLSSFLLISSPTNARIFCVSLSTVKSCACLQKVTACTDHGPHTHTYIHTGSYVTPDLLFKGCRNSLKVLKLFKSVARMVSHLVGIPCYP